jgi:hypothetical protein
MSSQSRGRVALSQSRKQASAGPTRDACFATVATVARNEWPSPPAITELCAPHNRRLMTDDRGFAGSRLPERA